MNSTVYHVSPSVIAPDLSDVRHPMLANRYPPLVHNTRISNAFALRPPAEYLQSPSASPRAPLPQPQSIHTRIERPSSSSTSTPTNRPQTSGHFYRRIVDSFRRNIRRPRERYRLPEINPQTDPHSIHSSAHMDYVTYDFAIPRFSADHHSDLGVVPIRRDSTIERQLSYRMYRTFQNSGLNRSRSQAAPISPVLSDPVSSFNMSPTIYSPPRDLMSTPPPPQRAIVSPVDPMYNGTILMRERGRERVPSYGTIIHRERNPTTSPSQRIRIRLPSRVISMLPRSSNHLHSVYSSPSVPSSGSSSNASFYSFENNDTPEDKLIGYKSPVPSPKVTARGSEILKILGFKDGKLRLDEDRSKIDEYFLLKSTKSSKSSSASKSISNSGKTPGTGKDIGIVSDNNSSGKSPYSAKYSPLTSLPSPYEIPTLSPLTSLPSPYEIPTLSPLVTPILPITSANNFGEVSLALLTLNSGEIRPTANQKKTFGGLLKFEYERNSIQLQDSQVLSPSSSTEPLLNSALKSKSGYQSSDNGQLISMYNVPSSNSASIHSPKRVQSSYVQYLDIEEDCF